MLSLRVNLLLVKCETRKADVRVGAVHLRPVAHVFDSHALKRPRVEMVRRSYA